MMKPAVHGLLCVLATSVLATSVLATGIGASAALAREPARTERRAALAAREEAATACFAETIGNNPAALAHARAARWYEAAGIIGFLCRPEVDAMAQAYDAIHGRGTGGRYFTGAYARNLGNDLAVRLKPLIEPTAVAHAEPRLDAEERVRVETVSAP
ncbi:MAG: hypothetical protein PGN34_19395 [Methylobacterium frigidaeris]